MVVAPLYRGLDQETDMILELIALIGLAVIAAGLVIGGWE